ncbi:histidine kinase dimerization/phosphoacceptor domain -containing protein [Leptospira andrefontaineae]|uniref:Histidine kinase n=1 Tax=Leptospira andrefontaineae TaxID=2484976 RepID=A0A4R9H0N8_9LEPT|nr:histidine kinase dimerization/phosphoacceptor domain -containing protein [Leptospira andrefontaineae]TGK37835.1 histidine kinase [Leptospira andrefontaineae]
MFEIIDTPGLHRKNYLFGISIVVGCISFGVLGFEFFMGNHTLRPGYMVAGIASILSGFLLYKDRYKEAVYLSSFLFILALGLGVVYGPGVKNAAVWFPVLVFFQLYFFNRKMAVLSMFFCLGLIFWKTGFSIGSTGNEIYTDSIASLCVLTLFAVLIGANMDKLILDKDILLKELSHRVRNNMQVILEMVSFLKDSEHSMETRNVLQILERRILALASVHTVSQDAEHVQSVSIGEVIENYLNRIVSKYKALPNLDPVSKHYQLDVKEANLLLLVLGEIVSATSESVTNHVEDLKISFRNPTVKTLELQVEGASLVEGDWSRFSRDLLSHSGGDLKVDPSGSGKVSASLVTLRR